MAFGLRLYKLDAMPLRGDEAFSVQYWAASPREVVRDLAQWEPHPLGTFFSFWTWKNLAGDSEFAMRYLPVLGNVLGMAGMVALGQRLFKDTWIAYAGAALWTVHPFLIWHAQDARNYALWAGLSPVAMWLFIRAADSDRPRDWFFYVLVEVATLYIFFLEGFLLLVQAGYLLVLRRSVFRRAGVAWGILTVLLIPWFVQLWYLAGSGYEGTLAQGEPAKLVTWFMPVLLTGYELASPWQTIFPLIWLALVMAGLMARPHHIRLYGWLSIWVVLPAILLLIAATEMSVFHPRYLIAVVPALVLLTAGVMRPAKSVYRAIPVALLIVPLLGLNTLYDYYRGVDPKSPDWPALAAYFAERTHSDELILQTAPDPAFTYYYRGPADENSIIPSVDIAAQLAPELNYYHAIWLVGRSPQVEAYLSDHMQHIGTHSVASFNIAQYRLWEIPPEEIANPSQVVFGDVARLRGYTIHGGGSTGTPITVLLYWEPLKQTEIDYKVFVHLIEPSGLLQDQDDHRPLNGFASTRIWETGQLYRDPYHLMLDSMIPLPPGPYSLQVGLYDPDTNTRLPVITADGEADSYELSVFDWQ